MSRSNGGTDIDFGGPATYRILVQGALSSDWSGRLAGMSIETVSREQGQPRTTLVGRIRDQTELSGVLDTLYGLHLSILEVKKLDHE